MAGNMIVGKLQIGDSGTSTNNATWEVPATPDGSLTLRSGNADGTGTAKVVVDNLGAIGVGTTPSGWGSVNNVMRAIQFGSGGSISNWTGSNGNISLGSNVFDIGNGLVRYITSNPAGNYVITNNNHAWAIAPTGTAGQTTTVTSGNSYTITGAGGTNYTTFGAANNNVGTTFTATSSGTGNGGGVTQNITFTQAMTLDASGNLLVGTTSRLVNFGREIVVQGTAGEPEAFLSLRGSRSFDANIGGVTFYNDTTQVAAILVTRSGSNDSGALRFITTSTGQNSERARITSAGFFKVSNTGSYSNIAGTFHELYVNSTQAICDSTNINANPIGHYISYSATPNNSGSAFLICRDGAATRLEVRSNGGIANFQANNVNLSDRREKTNFAPSKSYIDVICSIPVQTFNYADQNLEDDPGLTLGVVAQDVQAVAPELVHESNWGTQDEPKMRLSIYQTDLQYALMKCIQELSAQNAALESRLAALEAK